MGSEKQDFQASEIIDSTDTIDTNTNQIDGIDPSKSIEDDKKSDKNVTSEPSNTTSRTCDSTIKEQELKTANNFSDPSQDLLNDNETIKTSMPSKGTKISE